MLPKEKPASLTLAGRCRWSSNRFQSCYTTPRPRRQRLPHRDFPGPSDYLTPEQAGLPLWLLDRLDPDRPALTGHGGVAVIDPYRWPGFVGDLDRLE